MRESSTPLARESTNSALPFPQLLLSPVRTLIGVTHETGIRTLCLTESLRQVGSWNTDLVRASLKQKGVHDPRHVAGDASTGFRISRVMCMVRGVAPVLTVATDAHLVRIIFKFQRSEIVGKVRYVGGVTAGTLRGALSVTG
jgi:hypothetical protein